jgi:carboxylesterase
MQNPETLSFLIGPEDADCACLLIHGFSGSPSEMRPLGDALAEHGLRVYGVSIAGHSGPPDDLLKSTHRQWLASAEEGLAQLERYSTVFVIGLSMGGVLSLLLTIEHPERVQAVVALSTPTRFNNGWQTRIVPLARYFVKWFYPLRYLNFQDPKVQAMVLKEARARDPDVSIDFSDAQTVAMIKGMVRLPIPAIAELFTLTNGCRRKLHLLHRPLLIIQSHRDQTVNPACATELYTLARDAKPKRLHWLDRSDHVITTGPEKDEVIREVITFIDDNTADQEGESSTDETTSVEKNDE